jgi:hypothetical protein
MKNSLQKLLITLFFTGSLFISNPGFSQCSVTSTPTNTCTYGDFISAFTLGGTSAYFNNGCGTNGYNLFTKPFFSLQQGQTYSWSATVGNGAYLQCFAIWIDLNNNGTYETSEMLVNSSAAFNHSGSLTIPLTATATTNIHMRIRCAYTTSGTLWNGSMACTSNVGGFGETEDYPVDIACASLTQPSVTSPVSGCTGQQASLYASASTGTLTWYTSSSGGSSIGTGSPFLSPTISSSTNYYVAAETPGCTTSRMTVAVTAHQSPVITLENDTECGFCVFDVGNPGCRYQWSTGDTDQVIHETHNRVDTVYVTNSYGCITGATVAASVLPVPVITLGNVTSCGSVLLDAGNPGCTYHWSTGATTETIYANSSQVDTLMVTNGYGCTGYAQVNVTIHPIPTVNLGGNRTVVDTVTLNAGNPGCTYRWSTGETTQTIHIYSSQIDTVYVTNSYGCIGGDVVAITVVPSGGRMSNAALNDNACCGTSVDATGQLQLYPNPTNGKLNVSFNDQQKGNIILTITSMNGQLVYSESIDNFNGIYSKQVDLSNVAKGLYLVRINTEKQTYSSKINVQ